MPEVVFAIPGDLSSPTGGYGYDRRLLSLLPGRGLVVSHCALPGSFPWAPVPDLVATQCLLLATPEDAVILADGLAFGAMTDIVLKSIDRRFVALVHHPLALESGLPERRRRALVESERTALARACAVIVTSATTARTLCADYDVPHDRITVAEPGTDPKPRATGSARPGQPALLAVGAISPRKGYGVLIEALAGLADRQWTLTIVGALDRAADEADALRAALDRFNLADRIILAGVLDDAALDAAYAGADMFVHPALFEGYGMVLAEAMARGLPIVATTGGAAAQTVPAGAGILVAPGDNRELGMAIGELLASDKARAEAADRSWQAGQLLPAWSVTADRVAAVLRGVGA